MKRLCDLCAVYGTDKCPLKDKLHSPVLMNDPAPCRGEYFVEKVQEEEEDIEEE